MIEVRFHGRGGQGVVSAARLIAEAAILEGKYVQAFPEFGAERSGAPIAAYARVNDEPIELHSFIYHPGVVVVVDRSMAASKNTISGLAIDGSFVCNFEGSPGEIRTKLGFDGNGVKVGAVDATGVALKSLGRDFPNTPMLGALLKATNIVGMESMVNVMNAKFKGPMQASNAEALRLGYEGVKFA
jgi:2-oxoacid:acceptor oxidoreductase gamma subunit (pyruvate/2-ketoisovalerate family)